MKTIKKNKSTKNTITKAKIDENYQEQYKAAKVRIRLSEAVLNARKREKLSQQALAKRIGTTQKIVSKIENADVNIGIDLLNRITESLNFKSENFGDIFNCNSVTSVQWSHPSNVEIHNIKSSLFAR